MGRRRKGRLVSGWINLDKELQMSSAQAVNRLRRIYNAQKAGHAGTLDPLATGILPVAFGEATKTVPYLVNAEKEYRFTVRWGTSTTTDDLEGEVVEQSDYRPTEKDILAALVQFTGEINQIPPAYSAIKVDGKRAYARARAGETVELVSRRVHISRLDLVEFPDIDHAEFSVSCGKGTYIRSLARDLAIALGTRGHVKTLRRTRVGPFSEKNALTLVKCMDLVHIAAQTEGPIAETPKNGAFDALDNLLLPLTTALDDIPALPINEADAAHVKMGRSIGVTPLTHSEEPDGFEAVVMLAQQPVAIGKVTQGRFQPTRVFNL